MNKHEALEVLAREASGYRGSSHESLQRLLATPETKERRGTSETLYQIEVYAAWDDLRSPTMANTHSDRRRTASPIEAERL